MDTVLLMKILYFIKDRLTSLSVLRSKHGLEVCTPDYYFYNPTIREDYESSVNSHWDFKEQACIYLTKDFRGLLEIINKFNHRLFKDFDGNVSITGAVTIPGLAMTIFMRSHYNKPVIPLITDKTLYNNIKQSYYGGGTEVYRW